MPTRGQGKPRTESLEEKYTKLIEMVQIVVPTPTYHENLEQPSQLKVVDSVTTYGAYEEPI